MIITIILLAAAIVAGILAPEGSAAGAGTFTNDLSEPNERDAAVADACSTAASSNSCCCT